MPNLLNQSNLIRVLSCVAAMVFASTVTAQLDQAIQTETQINNNAQQSQARINNLAEETRDLLAEFKSVVRETESLKVYNDNLETVVNGQRREVASINHQLEGLESTNRGVVPLMMDMIGTLGDIVEADVPFRIDERRDFVTNLREMIDRADVTTSEKYRRVMEAYQRELEYGRTTEAYSAVLPGTQQTVDFLRVGRTLLFYQTSDAETTGWFNSNSRAFEELGNEYTTEVTAGISIARSQKAPDLVRLAVPAPEAAQ